MSMWVGLERQRINMDLGQEKKTPWCRSASELHRPSDRRLSAKLLPTFADRGCHVVSVTDPRGWVDPAPDPLLFFW
jgi:hypothetical protein